MGELESGGQNGLLTIETKILAIESLVHDLELKIFTNITEIEIKIKRNIKFEGSYQNWSRGKGTEYQTLLWRSSAFKRPCNRWTAPPIPSSLALNQTRSATKPSGRSVRLGWSITGLERGSLKTNPVYPWIEHSLDPGLEASIDFPGTAHNIIGERQTNAADLSLWVGETER